jgi:hypothetical protein
MDLTESKLKDFESYCRVAIEINELSLCGRKYKRKGELIAIARELEADFKKVASQEEDPNVASLKEQLGQKLISDYMIRLRVH